MQTQIMTSPYAEPPEAQGPGQASDDGSVTYGSATDAPRASAAAAAALLPPLQQAVANPRCGRCMDVPDDVITAVTSALRTAAREGRPR
jgi:hypothetical protein